MKNIVIHSVNSFVGKVGNIGYRAAAIIDEFEREKYEYKIIARGAIPEYKNKTIDMGFFGNVPRILNGYRIYVSRNFDCRKYDLWIFDKFASSVFSTLASRYKGRRGKKILHSWDYSPSLLRRAKASGYRIVQDVPIAPTLYTMELRERQLMEVENIDLRKRLQLEKECYSLSDLFIAPSPFVRDVLLDYGVAQEKIHVIPFGVNNRHGDDISRTLSYRDKGIDYCFAGNINSRKGVPYLMEAFSCESFKGDKLHLCGRLFPEQKGNLKKYNLGNIITPGFVDTESYFSRCDVYVFPSLMEGSSKSIYEAMMAGMPIITTYNAGSIVDDGVDGFIVPIGDVASLREKMLFLKNNSHMIRAFGEKAREKAKEYTWQRYACSVLDIYQRL